jgi:hypothetical protein
MLPPVVIDHRSGSVGSMATRLALEQGDQAD